MKKTLEERKKVGAEAAARMQKAIKRKSSAKKEKTIQPYSPLKHKMKHKYLYFCGKIYFVASRMF